MAKQFSSVDPHAPVLVGVGVAHHDSNDSGQPSPLDMMELALRDALEDTGVTDRAAWLGRIGTIAVTEGNWDYGDPARELARRVGVNECRTIRVDVGVPQHTPVASALRAISGGEVEAALIVGGEAKATQISMQRAGLAPLGTSQAEPELAAVVPDERWQPSGEIMATAEINAGMWSAVEHYACIEAALRRAEGRSVDQQLDAVADLWHRFNKVASVNPLAAFPEPRTAEFLRSSGPQNRPLAFPYAKWHSTQWAVDQAAALLICSVEVARELRVPTDQWIFPRVALESSFSLSLTKRANMHRWEAMAVLGDAAGRHLDRPLDQIEHVELYSCFPSAVQVQQRELHLDPEATPTITGGMAFAGGPFNNFTYQATAAMADVLRADPESLGLVTTVSGLLTKPALAIWSTEPGPLLVDDLGELAGQVTQQRDVVDPTQTPSEELSGEATIASVTVTYSGDEAASAFVIADLADGRRWIGTSVDPDLLSTAQSDELVGVPIAINGSTCQL